MRDSVLLEAYREYEWELLRFLARRLGSTSLAADLAHDLYVKLLQANAHPPIHDRRNYLFSMAANLATDHLRVESRRREILAEIDGLVWRRDDELTPERHAMARAEFAYLKSEIAKLPPRCRQVFYLSRFKGRTQGEIAEALGIGPTTVYKDLKTAIAAMIDARRRFRAKGLSDEEQGNT
ncbi:MAG: sigma-70 family RNA polymerase sigma factor [Alphaproteobacteria bacterium]|nr:sigma-70 family RNA polymerase sigma factor [Alphaproteobacteria bacterium]